MRAGILGILLCLYYLYAICEYLSGDVFLELYFFVSLFCSCRIYSQILFKKCWMIVGRRLVRESEFGFGSEKRYQGFSAWEGRKVHVSTSRE